MVSAPSTLSSGAGTIAANQAADALEALGGSAPSSTVYFIMNTHVYSATNTEKVEFVKAIVEVANSRGFQVGIGAPGSDINFLATHSEVLSGITYWQTVLGSSYSGEASMFSDFD